MIIDSDTAFAARSGNMDREINAKRAAERAVLDAARAYTDAREAAPIGDWENRIEDAGWNLAQAYRQYRKLL